MNKGINIREKGGKKTLFYSSSILPLLMVIIVLGIGVYQMINLKKMQDERIERKVEVELEKQLFY